MTPESVWLMLVAGLLSLLGTLIGVMYKSMSARLERLEKQDAKLNAAILTLLVAKSNDTEAVAHALHGLLTNGINTTAA